MAALQYAAATSSAGYLHHRHRRSTFETLNPSCYSTSFPSKPTRRKNYLRQKILKTLKKPIIPKLPPADPIIPIDSSPLQEIEEYGTIQEIQESGKCENSEAGNEEVQKFEELREFQVSEPAGVGFDGNAGVLAKSPILKYGLWLVGAFVFQTVCAVWFFGSGSTDNKNEVMSWAEKNSILEVGDGKSKSRVKFYLNGNGNGKMGVGNGAVDSIVYVDELEMERKIEEIQVMAREAREKERLELKKNDVDIEDGEEADGGKYFKSGIEEEVGSRLIKLRKKLENARKKTPLASVGYSMKENKRRDGFDKGDLDERESNGALLFKKKYKFKDLSGDPLEKPKGFIGSDDDRFERESDADNVVEEDKKKAVSEMSESTKSTTKKVANERKTSQQGKGKSVAKPKLVDGIVGEKNDDKSAFEGVKSINKAVKSRNSSALDIAEGSNELSKRNGSLKGKGVGDVKSAPESKSENDLWWLSLPYVLVIVMRRGDDGELGEGLYTLKSISSAEDQISHIVAFEDRADATNFCYLLQSFFEDLEDFNADVVPLTVKELSEAVKSRMMRVIVVRRGQLQLYAGQPLADAETALRAMIEQG